MIPITEVSADECSITLKNLKLQNDIIIDDVSVEISQASFNLKSAQINIEKGNAFIRISQENIKKMVISQTETAAALSKLDVLIAEDELIITGKYQVLIAPISFEVRGRLEIEQESKLNYIITDVSPSLAHGIVQSQIAAMNPLFNLQDLNLPVHIRLVSIEAKACWIMIKGEV